MPDNSIKVNPYLLRNWKRKVSQHKKNILHLLLYKKVLPSHFTKASGWRLYIVPTAHAWYEQENGGLILARSNTHKNAFLFLFGARAVYHRQMVNDIDTSVCAEESKNAVDKWTTDGKAGYKLSRRQLSSKTHANWRAIAACVYNTCNAFMLQWLYRQFQLKIYGEKKQIAEKHSLRELHCWLEYGAEMGSFLTM